MDRNISQFEFQSLEREVNRLRGEMNEVKREQDSRSMNFWIFVFLGSWMFLVAQILSLVIKHK